MNNIRKERIYAYKASDEELESVIVTLLDNKQVIWSDTDTILETLKRDSKNYRAIQLSSGGKHWDMSMDDNNTCTIAEFVNKYSDELLEFEL